MLVASYPCLNHPYKALPGPDLTGVALLSLYSNLMPTLGMHRIMRQQEAGNQCIFRSPSNAIECKISADAGSAAVSGLRPVAVPAAGTIHT